MGKGFGRIKKDLESRKVVLYICRMTKSIRISEKVHTKLKIYVAKNKSNIVEFADWAISKGIDDMKWAKEFSKYREDLNKLMQPLYNKK